MYVGPVVVYGSTLDSYCVIKYLLEDAGVSGSKLTLVQPFPPPTCFKSQVICDKMREVISTSGVTILEGYSVHQYMTGPTPSNELKAIELIEYEEDEQEDEHMITAPCKVMVATIVILTAGR